MLKDLPWIHYPPELMLEYQQALDEGREVEYLKEVCEKTAARAATTDCEGLARELREALLSAPVRPDYPFVEPSEWEAIRAQLPAARQTLPTASLSAETLREKLTGAWIGRISGCLLGKPVEGFRRAALRRLLEATDNYPMARYITADQFSDALAEELKLNRGACWADTLTGFSPQDDDTDYSVFALKLMETYGWDFRPDDVLEGWLQWFPYLGRCTAERVAYRNAAMGMTAPETALYNNPYREWIGAQIRGDFFGYVNPGVPRRAAELAWRDASVSHVKNGIYGEMWAAAMIAAAAASDEMNVIIRAGLEEVPEKCRLRRDVEQVLRLHAEGASWDDVVETVHQAYEESNQHGWCHTNSNAMLVAAALLYGEKDFGKSLCLAVQPGFDTDCNGATVGSVVGMICGASRIPKEWTAPYGEKLQTGLDGYNLVTVETLVDKTLEVIGKRPC